MGFRGEARALVRLALWVLVLAAGASGLEVLASQVPGSSLRLDALPGPIAQLRASAFDLALGLGLASWAVHALYDEAERPTRLVAAIHIGVGLFLAAQIYGAARGLYLAQLTDPRMDATVFAAVRAAGGTLLLVCGVLLALRATRRRPGGATN